MTRLFTIMIVIATFAATTSIANAQFMDGLPMQDSLGSGSGSFSSGRSSNRTSRNRSKPAKPGKSTYKPQRTNNRGNNNGFQPINNFQNTAQRMQQAQQIASAVAALGPAMQQARQNLQQIRARNGGYLIPRNNNGGLFGGGARNNGFVNNNGQYGNTAYAQPAQNMQRYGDYFGGGVEQVRQSLIRDGYQNVQVYEHPHNAHYPNQPNRQVYGVYYGGR